MNFVEDEIYHVYNRGNDKRPIFFKHENYIFFTKKIKIELCKYCNILAYCLMPNHYHLLIHVKRLSKHENRISISESISRKIGTLRSSYTRAIQKQENTTGSLFQQKAEHTWIDRSNAAYLKNCFHYIHQNPFRSKLATELEQWPHASFIEYHLQNFHCATLH
jgi:REP element-mobilizing transposase RayT